MARPTSRVLALLELLQAGGLHTAADLADRLGVDERTARRYLSHLDELGIPVESVRGRYGGYRIGAGARLPPLMLTDEEALTVAVRLGFGHPSTAADTASAKIRRVLPSVLAARLEALLASTRPGETPAAMPGPDPAVLLVIAEAVQQRVPLRIRHAGEDGPPKDRTVLPWGLVRREGRWYLTGPDFESDAHRTFRVDRIERADRAEGHFHVPPGFDAQRQVETTLARTPWRYEVVLLLRGTHRRIRQVLPDHIALLRDLPPASAPSRQQGWVRARLRAEHLDWVAGSIAVLDLPFVVEQPGDLRAELRRRAMRLLDELDR